MDAQGKWTLRQGRDKWTSAIYAEGQQGPLATIYNTDTPEGVAAGRLMEQAPELLDVARDALEAIKILSVDPDDLMAPPSPLEQRLEEIIRKAEGK